MLELFYDNEGDIPEGFAKLYTQQDGKWVLTGVNGMKTQVDVDTVKEALRKERENHAETKGKLKSWGDLDAEETHKTLDRIKELEAAAGDKLDEEGINKIVEGRIDQATGPLKRQIESLTAERDEATATATKLEGRIERRDMREQIREAALEAKVHQSAIPDIELVAMNMMEFNDERKLITKADGTLTPGLDLKGFFKEMGNSRSHWWPESEGGGAGGGKGPGGVNGSNPFSAKHWNLTEQGKILSQQGSAAAEAMAKAAGTTVGGSKPLAS